MTMTSRQRYEAACRRTSPDRPPLDYQAQPLFDARLRRHLDVASESELLDALGVDFFYLPHRDISQNESCRALWTGPTLAESATHRTCPFGITWTRGAGPAKFAVDEAVAHPLAHATSPRQVLDHPWPDPGWFDMEPAVAAHEAAGDRVVIGGFWSGILGDSYRMRGFQQFLTDMALQPDLIRTLINRMTDFYLELNERLFTALKGRMDIFYFGNDFGSQGGLLFSAQMWEDFFFENIRRLASLAHEHGYRVMMHSCGSIGPIIPQLIEVGIDILDPIQVTAEGMQPETLRDAHGDRLVFHGGIDTQELLRRADPASVAGQVRHTIDVLHHEGGYIVAPSQLLNTDIPVENAVALYEEAARPIDCKQGFEVDSP